MAKPHPYIRNVTFTPEPSAPAASVPDARFREWRDPALDDGEDRASPNYLSITNDPRYDIPGAVIIGLCRYGEYANIVLDKATALAFAAALVRRVSP
jgi:hypothetical protein